MANKQDYKLMLQKILDTLNRDDCTTYDSANVLGEAESLLKNDHTTYEWVIEWDGEVERFSSEKGLMEFIKDSFDKDWHFASEIERIYKVEVDKNGHDIKNEIDLNISWSFTIDG